MKRSLLIILATLCGAALLHADQTIRSLQQTLKQQGVYYGKVTGENNAETTAAIRRYQIRKGLKITGNINQETLSSLKSNSNSVAATSRSGSKPAATQPNSVVSNTSSTVSEASPTPASGEPARAVETNPSYAASFYQSAPPQMNRRIIAGAQYQLMRRGYYRARVDGTYGPQTAFALRAFQSRAGLVPTGHLDTQTLDALGLSDTSLAYVAPAPREDETWIPVRKFKHGEWKTKWKKYRRPWGGVHSDEDRQPNRVQRWRDYYNEH